MIKPLLDTLREQDLVSTAPKFLVENISDKELEIVGYFLTGRQRNTILLCATHWWEVFRLLVKVRLEVIRQHGWRMQTVADNRLPERNESVEMTRLAVQARGLISLLEIPIESLLVTYIQLGDRSLDHTPEVIAEKMAKDAEGNWLSQGGRARLEDSETGEVVHLFEYYEPFPVLNNNLLEKDDNPFIKLFDDWFYKDVWPFNGHEFDNDCAKCFHNRLAVTPVWLDTVQNDLKALFDAKVTGDADEVGYHALYGVMRLIKEDTIILRDGNEHDPGARLSPGHEAIYKHFLKMGLV